LCLLDVRCALNFSCFAIHGHLALRFITRILYFYRFKQSYRLLVASRLCWLPYPGFRVNVSPSLANGFLLFEEGAGYWASPSYS
jgi:hypothetical protein